jgi:DUF1009 family protein
MARADEALETLPASGTGPVGICCGSGTMPFAVADAVRRRGRTPVLFPIENFADPARVAEYQHHWVPLGKFGLLRRLAQRAGCRDLVFIGGLVRPRLSRIRLDWDTIKLLPRLAAAWRGGDNHLLTAIGRMFEAHGFRMVGAHEVAPEILMPLGVLGRMSPGERDRADIARGLAVLDAIGPFDVGQATVVADNHVVAVEALEGTDAMLTRIAELRRIERLRAPTGVGVLVKAPKSVQDRRYDLPSIGPVTVEHTANAGLAGIAVAAGATVVAEVERLIALADEAEIFVVGVRGDGTFD